VACDALAQFLPQHVQTNLRHLAAIIGPHTGSKGPLSGPLEANMHKKAPKKAEGLRAKESFRVVEQGSVGHEGSAPQGPPLGALNSL